MYAIIEMGGKQHRVTTNEILKVEKIVGNDGDIITIDKVMLLYKDEKLSIGKPYVEGAEVKALLVSGGRDKKVEVFKMKPRKAHRKHIVHRQPFTKIKIEEIIGG
ncbi:MAG: 50S ribosomal protein L21 [Nitrospirae bacterium]|nr:50S ribosomal protein L21 [Nitrospirota bacterium]